MKRDLVPLPAPPLTESELKKQNGTYNAYTLKLSWGQLNVIVAALERDHADPVSDELLAELRWMLENAVPGPGESDEDMKAREQEEKDLAELSHQEDGDDFPLPMPPSRDNPGEGAEGAEGGDPEAGLDEPPSDDLPGSEGDGPSAEAGDAPSTEVEDREPAVAESVKQNADKWLSSPPR